MKPVVATVGIEHMGGRLTIEAGPGGNQYVYSNELPENGGVITSLMDVNNNNIWLVEAIDELGDQTLRVRSCGRDGYRRTPHCRGPELVDAEPGSREKVMFVSYASSLVRGALDDHRHEQQLRVRGSRRVLAPARLQFRVKDLLVRGMGIDEHHGIAGGRDKEPTAGLTERSHRGQRGGDASVDRSRVRR